MHYGFFFPQNTFSSLFTFNRDFEKSKQIQINENIKIKNKIKNNKQKQSDNYNENKNNIENYKHQQNDINIEIMQRIELNKQNHENDLNEFKNDFELYKNEQEEKNQKMMNDINLYKANQNAFNNKLKVIIMILFFFVICLIAYYEFTIYNLKLSISEDNIMNMLMEDNRFNYVYRTINKIEVMYELLKRDVDIISKKIHLTNEKSNNNITSLSEKFENISKEFEYNSESLESLKQINLDLIRKISKIKRDINSIEYDLQNSGFFNKLKSIMPWNW